MQLTSKLKDKLGGEAFDPQLLALLEKAEPDQRLFRPITLYAYPKGDLGKVRDAMPPGKKPNDDLLWRVGEVAGCGPNESGRLHYHRVEPSGATIQDGKAEAIAEILESEHVVGAMVEPPNLFKGPAAQAPRAARRATARTDWTYR